MKTFWGAMIRFSYLDDDSGKDALERGMTISAAGALLQREMMKTQK